MGIKGENMKKEEDYKKEIINPFLLSFLACPLCGKDLQLTSSEKGLSCSVCKTKYPVIEGIPILFSDENRREFTVNKEVQDSIIQDVKKLNELKPLYRERLKNKITTEEIESLAWEKFFWRNWEENEDYGTIQFDKKRINNFLARDVEGGGRMRFFDAVRTNESPITGKILLNVGCGRDFLFEKFQESGAIVIEQDIVLDSLIKLKRRGALGICCDLRKLPIKERVVDIVTSFGVIHHVHPIEEPLSEISRVLKTKGSFYVNEPNKLAFGTLAKDLTPSFLRRMAEKSVKWGRMIPSPYEESINPKQFVSILKKEGFSTIKLGFIPKVQDYIPKPFQFPLSLLLRIFPIFSSHFEVYGRKEVLHLEQFFYQEDGTCALR